MWTKFEEGRLRRSWVIDRKRFWQIWPWWPWPLTPKSIGFLCCPGRMCGPSLRKVGRGVFELLIGNEKVTDGQTDRTTCAKQYALSSLKRGILILIVLNWENSMKVYYPLNCFSIVNIRQPKHCTAHIAILSHQDHTLYQHIQDNDSYVQSIPYKYCYSFKRWSIVYISILLACVLLPGW